VSGIADTGRAVQRAVDRHFDAAAGYWHSVYDAGDLQGRVYRRRMEVALAWAAELGPAGPGAEALDAGCGAGLMSVELARAGLTVSATDASPGMVAGATRLMAEQGVADRVSVRQADAHALPFEDGRFALVVALGVLPWLHDPGGAVEEMARVLAPGGALVLTADNRRRLNRLLEPREHPLLDPVRRLRRRWRERGGRGDQAPARLHDPLTVDGWLARAGLTVVRRTTVGYGPFTVRGRGAMPDGLGTRLNDMLHARSRHHPRLRGAGWHYVVAATKAGPSDG
jgi:ubiquinone/menaquinone biosynthesis C-methylase UbiE